VSAPSPSVSSPACSVAVVALFGARPLERCLAALAQQEDVPELEIVVAFDPLLPEIGALAPRHPGVRFVRGPSRAPTEITVAAVAATRGEIVLLTEDHCLPGPRWARALADALAAPDRAAAGGTVDTDSAAPASDYALYLVEFFRYAPPRPEGPSPSLTVCNVGYRRERLEAVADVWRERFHETAVHDALRARFGALWLAPAAGVSMRRRVRLRDAAAERFAYGRLFGCVRRRALSPARRAAVALATLGLPLLLALRLVPRAFARPGRRAQALRALPAVAVLLLAWSAGEWAGLVTGRHRDVAAAPERAD